MIGGRIAAVNDERNASGRDNELPAIDTIRVA